MKHFAIDEFACGCGCKAYTERMNLDFLSQLDLARDKSNDTSFIITSGYRCPDWNAKVGGKSASSHVIGRAADISVVSSVQRYWILKALFDAEFKRIGIGPNFIHADSDLNLSSPVVWTYY